MKSKFFKRILLGYVFTVFSFLNIANAGLIPFNIGSGLNSDQITYTFAAINVDTIESSGFTSIFNTIHDHSTNSTMLLDLYSGGVWTNVFAYNPGVGWSTTLDVIFASPINFTQLTGVTQMRLRASTYVGWMFHTSSNTTGTFDLKSTNVPEPSTLAIFTLGVFCMASRLFKKQY